MLPSRLALAALGGVVLSVAMHWTLVTNIDSVTSDAVDRYFQSWQLAWIGHAAKADPAGIVDSNTFWPLDNSLAFSDAQYGYAPFAVFGAGPSAAMARYNLLYLFSYALAFFGAAVLARELGFSWGAATVAGAAFAFAPWRIAHLNHLHVLSSGGIPLCLAVLLRAYRARSAALVLAGWALAAWQLSLGFTLGLQLAYLLAVLGALGLAFALSRGRSLLVRRVVVATAAGAFLFAVVGVAEGLPLLEVSDDHPESRRTVDAVKYFSPPAEGFLAAPPDSVLWGAATSGIRDGLRWPPEMMLFPGIAVFLLASGGLAAKGLSARWKAGLVLGVLVTGVLSMGYAFAGGMFYDPLYRLAPGWQASRTPGRLFTLTSLGLAVLAAAGAEGVRRLVARRGPAADDRDRRSSRSRVAAVSTAVLTLLILAEGKAKVAVGDVPISPVDFSAVAEPQLHLPSDGNDPLYMLWSTDGFPRIFNGYAGFVPTFQSQVRDRTVSFPDQASVQLLQEVGIRSVIVHLDRLAGSPWAAVPDRSIEGLPLERRSAPGYLVFTIFDAE